MNEIKHEKRNIETRKRQEKWFFLEIMLCVCDASSLLFFLFVSFFAIFVVFVFIQLDLNL